MAVFSSIFIPSGQPPVKIAALATTTASAEQVFGNNSIIAVNADQDITINWGQSGMAAPTTTDFRLPAGTTMLFDLGQAYDRFRVFNQSSTTAANVYIKSFVRNG